MMKKYLILFLTILAFAFAQKSLYAQSDSVFAPDHAEWWHYDGVSFGPTGHFGLTYSAIRGDTIIQGQGAKIVSQTPYLLTGYGDSTSIDTYSTSNLFIYDAADTVFIFNTNFNRFTPLFVFNVNVGDTVCLPVLGTDLRPNPIANGDTCFCFQIDSIKTVLYDTTYLTTYFEHSLIDSNNLYSWPVYNWSYNLIGEPGHWYLSGSYARKIGGLYSGFLPQKLEMGIEKPTQDTLSYHNFYEFRCYEDDSMAIHVFSNQGTNCFFDQPTGIHSINPNQDYIQVYPNPNYGQLTLNSPIPFGKNTIISISDLSGRVLKNWEIQKGQSKITLEIKDLSSGMYILKFESDGVAQFKKVVIQGR